MIEGAAWRRWVYFYIPLAFFVLVLLFPFYWMLVTDLPAGQRTLSAVDGAPITRRSGPRIRRSNTSNTC